jgi:predicted RNA-binding protein associated with RNAse of E/G family
MKHKRLDRASPQGWKFEGHPYYQMRVDIDGFHGLICLIKLISGKYYYWSSYEKSGKTAVCGKGMTWLQLLPDGKSHVITAKYLPKNKLFRIFKRIFKPAEYLPEQKVSLWYVDIIDGIEYDTDGVAVFIDKYLDVIFTPQGDMKIDDRHELEEAFQSGELTKEQYDSALRECDMVISELCANDKTIKKTELLCAKILFYVNDRIEKGENPFVTKYTRTT